MGVRGAAQLLVFVVVLFTVVAENPEGKSPEEQILADQINSVRINQELAEELWLNCRLELLHSNEAFEDLSLVVPEKKQVGAMEFFEQKIVNQK
ncbi:hypothetical protein P3S67_025748 [Capsicum chacoense]